MSEGITQLRDMRLADAPSVLEWRNSRDVAEYMYTDHNITEGEHALWFGQALTAPDRKYWIIEHDQRSVGLANLYDISLDYRRAYWAFYIADASVRGKGVGSSTERFMLDFAFNHLTLNKLCCEVLASNETVVRLHRKFGFTVDGLLRQHILKNGTFVDVVTLSLLASEWEAASEETRNS